MIKTIQVDLTNPKPKTNQKSNIGEPEQKNTKKNTEKTPQNQQKKRVIMVSF